MDDTFPQPYKEVRIGRLRKYEQGCKGMLAYTKIVLKFVEHHGWWELFRRIWFAVTGWFFENRSMFIMKLRPAVASELDAALAIKELAESEIDQMLKVMYLNRADILNRLTECQRCFAVLDGQKICTYFWVQFGVKKLDELHLQFNLKPNQAWFYNAVTVKGMRGRGYYPNIIYYMVKTLGAEEFDEFFIDVEERNIASIRGMQKAGCNRVVKVQMKKILSKFGYRITVFDKKQWQELCEIISDFPGTWRVIKEVANGN